MEKKSWWKRKSSDRSPGETESSTSISSHSESNSDEKIDHDSLQKSLNHSQSSEVTSRVSTPNTETNSDSFKCLTEKLSAALVNVGAKEDLVKQHAKVAEEAVAGWEKAENEVTTLKQQLESAVQQNLSLEVRTNHLDGALKECVKQLRQAKQEQEEEKHKWELTKKNLETQISNLEAKTQIKTPEHTPIDPKILIKLETLEKENSTLKSDLIAQSEELEIRTIERDLSTQAAEIASKQQLESIKKVAKLEAECRKLNSLSRKSVSINDNSNHKAASVTSFYVDSLTDSQSDRSEKLDVDSFKVVNKLENNNNESEDSWALALINELDQFKNGKCVAKNVEIGDIMDDFLEMERIASLSEGQNGNFESGDDLKSEVEVMRMRVCELEEKLGELEAEKGELESALKESKENLDEMKSQMVDLQKEVMKVNESKKLVECRLVEMEMEVDLVKGDFEKEKSLSSEMKIKCQKLEKEVVRKTEELKAQQAAISNGELKVKQDLEVAAADRLSECQKTISSLARQLESLATLEDFLIDTANLPGFNGGSSVAKTGVELWKLHSNDTFMPKKTLLPAKEDESICNPSLDDDVSPSSSSSSTSSSHSKSRNGFEKLFSRSKNGVQGEINQG